MQEKNIFMRDASGNWYSIPESLEQEFIQLNENLIETDIGTSAWFYASAELQSTFLEYVVEQ